MSLDGLPGPRYDHLLRLIDSTGVLEHARFGVPRREHGYTTDDAARALVVLSRANDSGATRRALPILLSFLLHAIAPDGMVHNRLGYDRRWHDQPHFGDHHGRTAWALGVIATSTIRPEWRDAAAAGFAELVPPQGPHLRPYAFASLGAAEIWEMLPGDEVAAAIFDRAIERLDRPGNRWPETRLTYSNGRIPHALLRTGEVLSRPDLVERGLERLSWLVEVETFNGHFSFAPVGGWSTGEHRPGFDQQPIEAAALADAALCAWRVTGDPNWRSVVVRAGWWLLGCNDVGQALFDVTTGACCDGLTPDGVNENQGAESTIAALGVLQACEQLRRPAVTPTLPFHQTPGAS